MCLTQVAGCSAETEWEEAGNVLAFAGGPLTKEHGLGGCSHRNLFSHTSVDGKSETRVPSGWLSGEISPPGL